MHPEVASLHGIKHGDWVIVTSPRGSIRMKALVTEDIHPKVINIEHAWWFPEKSAPDYGVWESNANICLPIMHRPMIRHLVHIN